MIKLFNAPVEILEFIFIQCTGHDLIVLTATCKSIRQTCRKSSFLQRYFQHNLPDIGSNAAQDKASLVRFLDDCINRTRTLDAASAEDFAIAVWTRLALGVSQLSSVKKDFREYAARLKEYGDVGEVGGKEVGGKEIQCLIDEPLAGVLGLMSMAAIWGLPSVCDGEVSSILDNLFGACYSNDYLYQPILPQWQPNGRYSVLFAFCQTMGTLALPTEATDSNQSSHISFDCRHELQQAVTDEIYDWNSNIWDNWQCLSLLLITYIAQEALSSFGAIDENGVVRLPDPHRIPLLDPGFTSGVGTPLPATDVVANYESGMRGLYPFATTAWTSWYDRRSQELALMICDGEWYGVETDDFHISCGSIDDGLMRGIRFRKVGEGEGFWTIEADGGSDNKSSFFLHGKITFPDGIIHLEKEYDEESLAWCGRITPLGLCGTSSTIEAADEKTGGFWLWKSGWMVDTIN